MDFQTVLPLERRENDKREWVGVLFCHDVKNLFENEKTIDRAGIFPGCIDPAEKVGERKAPRTVQANSS